MRSLLVAAATLLAAPTSASAANADVSVMDDFFQPGTVQIQPGESVTWHWGTGTTHTATAFPNQTIKFNSGEMSSGTFTKTFPKPGRFTYYCRIHGPSMRGAVEVGPRPFPDTLLPRLASVKAKTGDEKVKLSFRLSEKAKVKVSLSGPSHRSATKRLGKGRRSVGFEHLKAGDYKATLRATDGAGNRGRARTKRFSID
jgi:plastocyanin